MKEALRLCTALYIYYVVLRNISNISRVSESCCSPSNTMANDVAPKATRPPKKSEQTSDITQKSSSAVSSPKPKLTKAERRELQEKQRAAKANATGPIKAKTKTSLDTPAPVSQHPSSFPISSTRPPTNTNPGVAPSQDIKALHIFSHFGLPKSSAHSIKGDIHPAIARLALQFSEFKIVGANARCIATLTAFKTVGSCLLYAQ